MWAITWINIIKQLWCEELIVDELFTARRKNKTTVVEYDGKVLSTPCVRKTKRPRPLHIFAHHVVFKAQLQIWLNSIIIISHLQHVLLGYKNSVLHFSLKKLQFIYNTLCPIKHKMLNAAANAWKTCLLYCMWL